MILDKAMSHFLPCMLHFFLEIAYKNCKLNQ